MATEWLFNETLSDQSGTMPFSYTRQSVAYDNNGVLVIANVPVYEDVPIKYLVGTMNGVGSGEVLFVRIADITISGEGVGSALIGAAIIRSLSANGSGEGGMEIENLWVFNYKPKLWVGSVKPRKDVDSKRQPKVI